MKEKKYTLIITTDTANDTLNIECENDGFNSFEILGFLDYKRQDVIDQMKGIERQNVHFKRTVRDGDKIMEIEEDTQNDQT